MRKDLEQLAEQLRHMSITARHLSTMGDRARAPGTTLQRNLNDARSRVLEWAKGLPEETPASVAEEGAAKAETVPNVPMPGETPEEGLASVEIEPAEEWSDD